MFTRKFLVEIRRKALRQGVWFKTLDQFERGILSLTAQIVDRVKSEVLGVELVKLVKKIRNALKSGFVRQMEEYGTRKAKKIGMQAVEWGYSAAKKWFQNLDFAKYLTILCLDSGSWG